MHPMTEAAPGDYLTLEEAANLLKISPRTLLRYEEQGLIASGRLPGGGRRYREPDVRALISPPPTAATASAVA